MNDALHKAEEESGDQPKVGRPTKFKPEFVEEAKGLAEEGLTDEEIAQSLGVNRATLYQWKKAHPEFRDAIRVGKAPADDRVEQSLYHRAIGYEHDDVDIRTVSLGEKMGSEIVETPIRKYYPPDTTAAIFWLKNRRPDTWRDKQEIAHTGDMTVKTVPTDELREHIRAMVREHAASVPVLGPGGEPRKQGKS